MLGGLGGSSSDGDFAPSKAPKPPRRDDTNVNRRTMKYYQKIAKRNSYSKSILGGSADAPARSYTAQLFSGGGV